MLVLFVLLPLSIGRAEEIVGIMGDTVAIYLALSDELCEMKTLGIVVDYKGYTRIKKGPGK